MKPVRSWGVLWRSKNRLDGIKRHLLCNYWHPNLFRTRREAVEWIEKEYGYIRDRPDLRAEPHGWKMPIPIRVVVDVEQ